MTRKQALLAAIRDLLEEAKTLEAWMDDTAYPRRSRASWDESLGPLKTEYQRANPNTLWSVASSK
jgi:anti-sigma-K factor RskA